MYFFFLFSCYNYITITSYFYFNNQREFIWRKEFNSLLFYYVEPGKIIHEEEIENII